MLVLIWHVISFKSVCFFRVLTVQVQTHRTCFEIVKTSGSLSKSVKKTLHFIYCQRVEKQISDDIIIK